MFWLVTLITIDSHGELRAAFLSTYANDYFCLSYKSKSFLYIKKTHQMIAAEKPNHLLEIIGSLSQFFNKLTN